jgi:predicted ATP-grasp superfamily ATP-dependent carboligase
MPQGISGVRVLVTDEHYKHTLGIVRQLGKRGAVVSVIASSKKSLACLSRFCSEVILSKDGRPESLIRTILQTIRNRHFDVLLPVSYTMTLALAQRKDEILPYTQLEVCPCQTIAQAADKREMIRLAQTLGVPAPKTMQLNEVDPLDHELRSPLVIKPGREIPGRPPIRYVQRHEELSQAIRELRDSLPPETFSEMVLQEYIPGHGCGLFATYQNGVCKRVFMHRRVREYPATGGVSSCAESFYDARLEFYGTRMLGALDWHGVAMVEFRRDARDGEYKLMEINPKFWGSLDLALAAGADFPVDLCQMALGRNLAFSDQYTRSLRFHWPLSGHGDLYHLWTRPRSFFAVALDCLDPRVKSNVCLGDLRPNLWEVSNFAGKLLRVGKV